MATNAFVAGYTLFVGEKVTLDVMGPTAVDATVRGEIVRLVNLRAADGRLAIRCACAPENMKDPAGCKHAWAAMLEIDRRGTLDGLRAMPGPIALVPWGEEGTPAPKTKTKMKTKKEASPTTDEANAARAPIEAKKANATPKPTRANQANAPKEPKANGGGGKHTAGGASEKRNKKGKGKRPPSRSDRKKSAA